MHIIPSKCTFAWSDRISFSIFFFCQKKRGRKKKAMLVCLKHAILVWAVSHTGCRVFSSPWCSQTQATHGKGRQAGRQASREGDVALGLTNDLDTWLWISFSFVTAYKRISLYSNIHMASMQLERIQKGPTGKLVFFIMLNHSFTCSLPDA